MTTRILLVDDHALVRQMLSERLQRENEFEIVGTARDAGDAIDLVQEHQPDVVVMDIDMPGISCFTAVRRIRATNNHVQFVFLSAHVHDHYIDEAIQIGARSYLAKSVPPSEVIEAIRAVATGGWHFSSEVQSRMVFNGESPELPTQGKSRIATLTPRELEVLRYVAAGHSKKEIAGILHVALKTVEKHTDNLMRKLDIHDRVDLTRFAIREGLAEP